VLLLYLLPVVTVSTFGLTHVMRLIALKHEIIDTPNERSSHEVAVPRGGGAAIVVVFLASLAFLVSTGMGEGRILGAIGASAFLVAIVGILDDRYQLPASSRFIAQIVSAVVFLALLPFPLQLKVAGAVLENTVLMNVLAGLYLIWMTNLYNFMDGIDGIAGTEAVTTATGAGVLLLLTGEYEFAYTCFALATACLGFLKMNWPPARIFMGDVGSGFIGFVLAALSIATHVTGAISVWVWLILLGVFIVDATTTLITRIIRHERWTSAHKSHAYQKLSRKLNSHLPVTVGVATINVLWLMPLAALSSYQPDHGWWLTAVAWLPLLVAALWLGAGRPD